MATGAQGYKGYLQAGRESTWGTAVAATHRWGILDAGIDAEPVYERDLTINNSRLTDPAILVAERCTGYFEMFLDYDTQLLLFDCLYGTATFAANGGADSGAGPYVHTWNDGKEFYNSLTLQFIEGGVVASKCARVVGAKITGATLTATSSAVPRIRFTFVGKYKEYNITPTAALTATTRVAVLFRHLTACDNGSGDAAGDQKIESIEVTWANALSESAWTGASGRYIDEPLTDGQQMTTLKLVQRMHTKTLQDAYQGETNLTPNFTFTSGTRIFTLSAAKARLTAPADPKINTFGILKQELSYECHNGGSYALQLVITNGKATITTP